MERRHQRPSCGDGEVLHNIPERQKVTRFLQQDPRNYRPDHAMPETAQFFAPFETRSEEDLYHILACLAARSSIVAIQSNAHPPFESSFIRTSPILLLHMTRVSARHYTNLELLKRGASWGEKFTALMSIIEWNICFPDSSKSIFVVESLHQKHNFVKSYAIPFQLSREKASLFPHSELCNFPAPNNSRLGNSTCINQSVEDWLNKLSASNDDTREARSDCHIIFKKKDWLFSKSKLCSIFKIIKDFAVDKNAWMQTFLQKCPKLKRFLGCWTDIRKVEETRPG